MVKKKEEEKEEKAVTVVEPAGAVMNAQPTFEDDAGVGFENMGVQDMALPFIAILQSGSPQVKRGEQKIEGAAEGDIFNTVTGQVHDGTEGIYVIPCAYKKAWVEWRPRDAGGGFVRQHDDEFIMAQTTKDDKNKDFLPNGNVVVPTAYHYVLIVDTLTGGYTEGVISMTSTQLKKSRKWNSTMAQLKLPKQDGTMFTPPMFSHVYHLTTIPEANDVGAWSGWKIDIHSQVPSIDWYNAAKKFSADVRKGIVKEAIPTVDTEPEVF